MQITRYTSLKEEEFLGCTSAFVDSLFGELNSAVMYLRKLQGQPKGAAFAFEMSLDLHRYGAVIILDRWAEFMHAFGTHLAHPRYQSIISGAGSKVQTAENILGRTNQVIDSAAQYSGDLVAGCVMALQSLQLTFEEEHKAAVEAAKLGPMLSEEFKQARRIFLGDLAAR